MSKKETYESKTEALLQPILGRKGFTLWSVEYIKEGADRYLRVYIDKERGITIDDCVSVSRELSEMLDRDDFIEDAYILEVSSPGLGRILKKDRELSLSIGRKVDIRTYKPVEKVKEFSGTLKSFDKDTLSITVRDGSVLVFKRSDIAKVSLSVEL